MITYTLIVFLFLLLFTWTYLIYGKSEREEKIRKMYTSSNPTIKDMQYIIKKLRKQKILYMENIMILFLLALIVVIYTVLIITMLKEFFLIKDINLAIIKNLLPIILTILSLFFIPFFKHYDKKRIFTFEYVKTNFDAIFTCNDKIKNLKRRIKKIKKC